MLSEHLHNQAVAQLSIIPQAKAGLAPTGLGVSTPDLAAGARGQ